MSHNNYILDLLNIKDQNITFDEDGIHDEFIKNKTCKIINAHLSYIPTHCDKCGCVFESNDDYEKKGFDKGSYVVVPTIFKMTTFLFLKKQRILCHHCNHSFSLKTDLVNFGCFISNITKLSIVTDLTKKRSEKDISIDNNVSPNTVERVMDSYYDGVKLYKNHLPKVLSFDEFKSVKDAYGKMSFIMVNGENGKVIDVIQDRKLMSLLKYFNYYSRKARARVKFIVIDMYSPYITLIGKMFPNAKIIIDKFHLTQLISRSLNKTRIMVMKNDKKNYNKFKRYWKLILKARDELDSSHWKMFRCFDNLMTEVDIVEYLINTNEELKNTYQVYQDLLYAFQHNNYKVLRSSLNNNYGKISSYMITSIKTLKNFSKYIINTFKNKYHNGFVEGTNNFIKVIKRIAFGFRNFSRFKARIMICKGLILPIRKEA